MRVENEAIITNGAMTGNINSDPIRIEHIIGFSIHAVYTGSPNGSLKLQASNDEGRDAAGSAVTNWIDVPDSDIAISAAGNSMWNVDDQYYMWFRLVYTFASGTGTLNARMNLKGV